MWSCGSKCSGAFAAIGKSAAPFSSPNNARFIRKPRIHLQEPQGPSRRAIRFTAPALPGFNRLFRHADASGKSTLRHIRIQANLFDLGRGKSLDLLNGNLMNDYIRPLTVFMSDDLIEGAHHIVKQPAHSIIPLFCYRKAFANTVEHPEFIFLFSLLSFSFMMSTSSPIRRFSLSFSLLHCWMGWHCSAGSPI
jgi:hypothetical protein